MSASRSQWTGPRGEMITWKERAEKLWPGTPHRPPRVAPLLCLQTWRPTRASSQLVFFICKQHIFSLETLDLQFFMWRNMVPLITRAGSSHLCTWARERQSTSVGRPVPSTSHCSKPLGLCWACAHTHISKAMPAFCCSDHHYTKPCWEMRAD